MRSARWLHAGFRGLLSGLLLSGCVNLAKSFPEKRYYSLEVSRPSGSAASTSPSVVKLRRFRVSPSVEGKEFVYRTSEVQYESDFYNEWFVPPSAMLTQQALNWLLNAGIFRDVVDSSSALDAAYVLEGTVTALYGDYRRPDARKAVIGLQVALIDESSTRPVIVFQRDYHRAVEMTEASPDGLAKGWSRGLEQIFTALEDDLRAIDLKMNHRNPPGR